VTNVGICELDLSEHNSLWIISDLHLSSDRPDLLELLRDFVNERLARGDMDALILLGDVFEYWIGDDAVTALGHEPHIEELRRVRDAGIPIWFLHGNRDFLVGEEFCRTIGATLLAEIATLQFAGTKALLCHGDELCTDDHDHQQFRSMVRASQWQQEFLARSVDERIRVAQQARSESKTAKQTKSMQIMDVNDEAVDALMDSWDVDLLIHGHTHRPQVHQHRGDGNSTRTRVVLGDWGSSASFLAARPGAWRLESGSGRPGPFTLVV